MLKKLFRSNRCKICKDHRQRRFCVRTGKDICYHCCLDMKMDLRCPEECSYSLKKNTEKNEFLNYHTKVDSIEENYELMKRIIDRWFSMPSKVFKDKIPSQMIKTAEGKNQLQLYFDNNKLPANIPLDYLYQKIGITKETKIDNYEKLTSGFLDKIIEQDWAATIDYLHNSNIYDENSFKTRYLERLSKNKILKKVVNYDIIASALSENRKESLVLFELNKKYLILFSLVSINNKWKIKQKVFGDFDAYYNVTKAIQHIAVLLSQSKLGNVYDDLKKASLVYPDNPDLMYYWGLYYSLSKDLEKSLSYFLQAFELDANFDQATYNIGFIYQAKRENDEAKKWYNKVLEINPNEYKTLNNLSVINEEEENFEEAYKLIKRCLSIKPDFEHAQKNHERLKTIMEGN